jgi:parvulin-like peptidyl-prolyl isomerase
VGIVSVQQVSGQQLTPETVLARVGDEPITLGEVIQALRIQFAGRDIPQSALPSLSTQMLDRVVRQKLIALYAQKTGAEVDAAEVDEQLGKLKSNIAEVGMTFERFLTERGLTDVTLREQLTTDIMLQKYFETQLTDTAVRTYFDEHHTEFDGSEKRLGHVMIRPAGDIVGGQQAAVEKANQIRQQIVDGGVDFAEAARRYSDAPSRRDGGDLGYMKRDAPWDPVFMKAAFALAEDELSDAVVTAHGVHLIRCNKIRRGYQTFENARPQVAAAALDDLRRTIVDQERARTPVVFTGIIAHVDLDTGKIVPPKVEPSSDTP